MALRRDARPTSRPNPASSRRSPLRVSANLYLVIRASDRLILALDIPHDPANPDRPIEVRDAQAIVDRLGDRVTFYKVGWPLYLAPGTLSALAGIHLDAVEVLLNGASGIVFVSNVARVNR